MPKSKKGRAARRRRLAGVDERSKDRIQTTYGFPPEPLPDFEETERKLDAQFRDDFPEIVQQWYQIYILHRILIEKRPTLEDSSDLRVAVDLLGSKAFGDARGAQVLLERGYAMASLGPLRAASEAADLMNYFLMFPSEAKLWLAEDKKFDNLGWMRKELPVDPTPAYEFANLGMHANWRLIPHMMRKEASPLNTHYEIVPGPVRAKMITEVLSAGAVFQALKVVAQLHDHHPEMVSDVWRKEFESCRYRHTELQDKLVSRATETLALINAFAEIAVANNAAD